MLSRVALTKSPLTPPPLRPADLRPLFYSRRLPALPGSVRVLVSIASDTANYSHRGAFCRAYRTLAGLVGQNHAEEGFAGSAQGGSATGRLYIHDTPVPTSHRLVPHPKSVNKEPGSQPRIVPGSGLATTTKRPYTTSSRRDTPVAGTNSRVLVGSSLHFANRDRKILALDKRDIDGRRCDRGYSSSATPEKKRNMYTASFAFFEAIWEAGITHCFVNLGSDHPSIIEAMVKGQREKKDKFPRIITCPNEVGDPWRFFGDTPYHFHAYPFPPLIIILCAKPRARAS